jgi:hypothetical protein
VVGEILAAVGIVVAVVGIVELERLRRTIEVTATWFHDPVIDLSRAARTYHWRNRARQRSIRTTDTHTPHPEVDARPASQHRLRIRREAPDDGDRV